MEPPIIAIANHFINIGGAKILTGVAVFDSAPIHTNIRIGDFQMTRLVLIVFRVRVIDVGQLVYDQLVVILQSGVTVLSRFDPTLRDLLQVKVPGFYRELSRQSASGYRRYSGRDHSDVSPSIEPLVKVP